MHTAIDTIERHYRNRLVLLLLALLLFTAARSALSETIDIMVVYDSTAATWVADKGGMEAFAFEAINRMNQAMENSEIDLDFRLVHTMETGYTYSGSLASDLQALQQGAGSLEAVLTARDTYGADLVTMLVDTGSAYGWTGVAYQLTSWAGHDQWGFSVNSIQAVEISHVLTHEVGHNLGAEHAKNQEDSPGPNTYLSNPSAPYSAGWYFQGDGGLQFHTIMAYNSNFGVHYTSAPLFSSPLLQHEGGVAGHSQDGDNARLIRETKGVVANYRQAETVNYPLSVSMTGDGSGRILSAPSGIDCGSVCLAEFPPNTDVRLDAVPEQGSVFAGWNGACGHANSDPTCWVSMEGQRNVVAKFTLEEIEATWIENDTTLSGLAGSTDSKTFFKLELPLNTEHLKISTEGGSGDVNLYVRQAERPTLDNYDCKPYLFGNDEMCEFDAPASGIWYIMLHGYEAYEDVALTVSYREADTGTGGTPVENADQVFAQSAMRALAGAELSGNLVDLFVRILSRQVVVNSEIGVIETTTIFDTLLPVFTYVATESGSPSRPATPFGYTDQQIQDAKAQAEDDAFGR